MKIRSGFLFYFNFSIPPFTIPAWFVINVSPGGLLNGLEADGGEVSSG